MKHKFALSVRCISQWTHSAILIHPGLPDSASCLITEGISDLDLILISLLIPPHTDTLTSQNVWDDYPAVSFPHFSSAWELRLQWYQGSGLQTVYSNTLLNVFRWYSFYVSKMSKQQVFTINQISVYTEFEIKWSLFNEKTSTPKRQFFLTN